VKVGSTGAIKRQRRFFYIYILDETAEKITCDVISGGRDCTAGEPFEIVELNASKTVHVGERSHKKTELPHRHEILEGLVEFNFVDPSTG
jgi:hypothetical protein